MAQQPYTEIDYNHDIVSMKDWENTDIGECPIDIDSHEAKVISYVSFSCGICGASLSSTTTKSYIPK